LKKYNEQEAKNIERRIKRSETGEFSLSKYSPGHLEPELMIKQIHKAKCAFPANPPEFWDVLMDRLIEKGFTNERLRDAVDYVIDTCQYPTPTAANFLSYDRLEKLYTYNEVCDMVTRDGYDMKKCFEKVQGTKFFKIKTS
jgi:hypothetical protein